MNYSNNHSHGVNDNGVFIARTATGYDLSYLVSSSDDFEIELSIADADVPAFLKRHNCRTLNDVDMCVLFAENEGPEMSEEEFYGD